MGTHAPPAACPAIPVVFEHPALPLKSRVFGVQVTVGGEQAHWPHWAGWELRPALPLNAVVGSEAGHPGTPLGAPS